MKHLTPQAAFRALRQRAELRRQAAADGLATGTLPQLQHLMQELQLNQLELESQNEELRRAQTAAARHEARYTDLYHAAPLGYCTLDLGGLISQVNQRTSELLGTPPDQLLRRRLAAFVAPASRGQLAEFLARLRAAPGQRHTCELSLDRAHEQPLVVEIEGVQEVAQPGQLPTYHLILLDVSARHRATQLLAASEARFRATFEQSLDSIALLENECIVAANNALLRLLGLSGPGQLLGRPLAEYWPGLQPSGIPTHALLRDGMAQAYTQGWGRLELLRHGPAGEPEWAELSFNPIELEGQTLLQVTWRDISVRKRQEQLLRDSEANLQQALAAADTGVWSWDLATDVLDLDARAQEIFNLSSGVPLALLQAVIHPADLARVFQTLNQARQAHQAFDLEHRLVRPDGGVRHVAASGRFSYDEATGRPQCLRGLVRDTTARCQVEQELDYKTHLLDSIVHNMPLVLARLDAGGRLLEHVGQPLQRMGLTDNELLGAVAVEEFPEDAAHLQQVLAGQPVAYIANFWRNGQLTSLQMAGFFDQERREAVLFGVDVTESERLKEEATRTRLRQQQELHAIILSTQEEERRRIAESLHNGVGQLLYATRLHLDTLPPSPALADSQQLLNEAIRATRTISFELTPSVIEDFGLPAALRELIKRIPVGSLAVALHLDNLGERLPASLSVATYRIVQELLNNVMKHAQAHEVFVSVAREAGQLHISVEDDGVGLVASAPEGSTGIGLAGIRTRVGLLGGSLEVKSRPGRGTGFFLQLPVQADLSASEG